MVRYRALAIVLASIVASACTSSSAPSAPTAPVPAAATAVVSVTALTASAEMKTTGAVYHASLQLKETGGKSGATISSINFVLQADKGKFTANYAPPSPQRVAAGGALDIAAVTIPDDSGAATTVASQLSVTVNFVDDGGRNGTSTADAAVTRTSAAPPAAALNGLSGVVTDGSSGGVLPNILVRVTDGPDAGKSASTDASGRYTIDGLSSGTVDLLVTATSYLPTNRRVTVAGDTRFDIVLSRCPYTLTPGTQAVASAGGSFTVQLATDADCPWTATSNAPWIAISSSISGTGNASIAYVAAANSGAARNGTLNVAGQLVTITQAAAPPPPPPPPPPVPPDPAPAPPAPAPPAPAPPAPAPLTIDLTGAWSGTASDSQGPTVVTWALTQTGSSISGSITTNSPTNDGSCSSCHRNKRGSVTGTLNGTTLTLFFPAGGSGDPTPMCSSTLTGSAASVTNGNVVLSYSGADTCEGALNA